MFRPRFRDIHDPPDASVEAYWFTHAGGGVNTLKQRMGGCGSAPTVRVRCPVSPAREELVDVTFDGDLNQMASLLAGQIETDRARQDPQIPLVLIGHSYGSILAYRVVEDLLDRGITPHRLVVMASAAPDVAGKDRQLHTLGDEELLHQVDRLFGGVPEIILNDRTAHEFLARGLRHDLRLLERYEHRSTEPIAVPIVAVCGMDDRTVDVGQMQRWERFTSGRFQLRWMPGDHFFPVARMPEILQIAVWDAVPG